MEQPVLAKQIGGGDLDWPDALTNALRKIDTVLQDHKKKLSTFES